MRGFVRQDKTYNCSAVAIANALAWLGYPALGIETLEEWTDSNDDRGGHYERAAFKLWEFVGLEIFMPMLWADEVTEDYLRGPIRDGWIWLVTINSPHTEGRLHAVAVADEAFTVLDGQLEEPVVRSFDWLSEHRVVPTMAIRRRSGASATWRGEIVGGDR